MNVALDFQHVDILFARERGRQGVARIRAALESLDAGRNRAQIAAQNGVVVGVADASLKVEHGHISVLMGLSGSGKSTLLRAANGLNPVTRGRVLISDNREAIDVASCDATTLRRLRRGRIAMMFQQFGLLPWRTVRDNVGFGLELRGEPAAQRRRVVDEKLELVGLSQWADRYVNELSGGMQQRVGLARAFATEADILLMDEPFSALDPLIRTKLQDELCALQERVKKTILFVTHDLDEALKLGDQISVLEGGRIVQTGAPEDIVLRPADAYVAEFVQHMNPLAVLTGRMVMRHRRDLEHPDGSFWLDRTFQYQLVVGPRSEPVRAVRAGVPVPLCDAAAPAPAGLAGVPVADADTPLRRLIDMQRDTGHPVVLTESGGFCGVCGPGEVIAALAGRHDAPGQADAAN
ncbi:MAG TPA: choline ABC transporter ATP-binding protein [Steroidobacteraceae bacterium]|nr:choline ABC transporter ATP-binding protein [Steroidobacteraceae bacterium]